MTIMQSSGARRSFEALVASLSPRMWINAQGGTHLTLSGLNVDAATDLSGGGNSPTETGSRRPTYDATAFGGKGGMLFTAANNSRLLTPSFAMGARSSGSAIWRPTGNTQGLLEFHTLNSHTLIFTESGRVRVRRTVGGEATFTTSFPVTVRCTWSSSNGRVRALFNGVEVIESSVVSLPSVSAPLTIGAISTGALYPLDGAIGEIVFADATWTDAEIDAVDAAMAARWA